MSLHKHDRDNFQTLLRAAADGQLALLECKDAVTGEYRAVICAVGSDNGDCVLTPFGHLSVTNPFEAYIPPDASSGEHEARADDA